MGYKYGLHNQNPEDNEVMARLKLAQAHSRVILKGLLELTDSLGIRNDRDSFQMYGCSLSTASILLVSLLDKHETSKPLVKPFVTSFCENFEKVTNLKITIEEATE